MTRLLLTGSGGQVGAAVARRARNIGLELTLHRGARDGDLLDERQARRVVTDAAPDTIIHAVGRIHGAPEVLWRDNLMIVVRLLDAVAAAASKARVVLLGSAAEYGLTNPGELLSEDAACRPNSEYGMSKLAATRVASVDERVDTCVARIFNVVGQSNPPLSLLGRVERAYRKGETMPEGAEQVRDFVPLNAVARTLVTLALAPSVPEVVNVCTGLPRSAAEQLGRVAPEAPGDWSVGDPSLMLRTIGGWVGP